MLQMQLFFAKNENIHINEREIKLKAKKKEKNKGGLTTKDHLNQSEFNAANAIKILNYIISPSFRVLRLY